MLQPLSQILTRPLRCVGCVRLVAGLAGLFVSDLVHLSRRDSPPASLIVAGLGCWVGLFCFALRLIGRLRVLIANDVGVVGNYRLLCFVSYDLVALNFKIGGGAHHRHTRISAN